MTTPVCRILATVRDEREAQRFCVYNQTSECFLSLGVTAAETAVAEFEGLIERRELRSDEGIWLMPSGGVHTFSLGMAVPLDLVYLDKDFRVVRLVESVRRFRIPFLGTDIASALALPIHTIYSSQTQRGNQLVICIAEEMGFQIGVTPGTERPVEITAFELRLNCVNPLAGWFPIGTPQNRRIALRQHWPRLIAHDWDGAALVVYGIRDASATGLYLLTEKRWRLGALVTMTLLRTDNLNEDSESSITVQLRVTRWGQDGVGLSFVLADALESAQSTEEEPISDDLRAVAMQDKAKWANH